MTSTIKIAVPMAGYGSRMRPHTWSKAKPLVPLAGMTVLDHVLEQFDTLPAHLDREYIFIVGPYQLDQVKAHMEAHHPEKKVNYAVQELMRGQSDALYIAREFMGGPMLMSYCDTMIETDLSETVSQDVGGIAWVQPVEDPRRFGVAQLDGNGWITRLIEKPRELDNKLAVVGFYYFRDSAALLSAIEEQFKRNIQLKNEYFLVDSINIMLENGVKFRTQQVDVWLDAGIPSALLETNRHLLTHGHDNSIEIAEKSGSAIIPPVNIHPGAQIKESVIGPHVSIGDRCVIERVVLSDSILADGVCIHDSVLSGSIIGRDVRIEGKADALNLGDNSWLKK